MGFRPRRKIQYAIIYAKPKNPPKWWPRDAVGRAEWVVVTNDGCGFSTRAMKEDNVPLRNTRQIMATFGMAHERKFQFRVVRVTQ